ncbi:hypothetical protein [Roseimicrobium sp. ORNL1]|uniref:hypothetical protein n=1 Tax=Roseimicrobium sp. ORNL1 TaxID=2711231 RepID=UPI0013E1DB66|nr:hypothetical protein [Roseimicrobium sp. ORNL1]QIF04781.1 hypothetical protein G5S37_25780 [Roseimicrobium sp. ORNL1]
MKAHQLIASISPALQQEILGYIQTETKDAFRTALYQVGATRKLRPQYFDSKSKSERIDWLLGHMKQKALDGVSEQLLQLWLLKAKVPMLAAFLDAAGIKHDGKGQVDDLPETLEAKKVAAGVDAMLKDNSGEQVALYLYMFQQQRPGGWPEIAEALEKRAELKLG